MNDSPWNCDYAVPNTGKDALERPVIFADDFEIGDIVCLASGSPELTVVDVCECGAVKVAWYDEFDGMQEASFSPAALINLNDDD